MSDGPVTQAAAQRYNNAQYQCSRSGSRPKKLNEGSDVLSLIFVDAQR
jgi:hypothetical protein